MSTDERFFTGALSSAATFSACGRYRWTLVRKIPGVEGPTLAWLMLNPSTADELKDDPTIRKVIGFTRRYRFGAAHVVNLFALRETSPAKVLRQLADAEGDGNWAAVTHAARVSEAVVCAWGAQPWAREQAETVMGWLKDAKPNVRLLCLGYSSRGAPLHPLTLGYEKHRLVPYEHSKWRGVPNERR